MNHLLAAVMYHLLVIGEPGSGKTFGTAARALTFPGAVVSADPHWDSLSMLLLEHAEGDILFHRISDLNHALGYDLLRASKNPNPVERYRENRRRARLFVEVMMRRRGGDIAGTPLMEEWVLGLLLLYLHQGEWKDPKIVPYGFRPDSAEFKALLRDCELNEIRNKFEPLAGLNPRALRAEVGSAARLVGGVFGSPEFLAACRPGVHVGAHIQRGGKLLLERGSADEDVTRTIIGGLNLDVTEHCENRPEPYPPVAIILDECTNARTAGDFEQRKAGETRKRKLNWWFICQHPNFPGGADGYFQNCQEKHFYRTGDYTLARKLASFVAAAIDRGEASRAETVDRIASDLMTFGPGWRYVVGPDGARKEKVPMLTSDFPDWPGLRQDKLEEKLCQIYSRPEYRTPGRPEYGAQNTPSDTTSPSDTPSQPSSSRAGLSPAERWARERKRRADGSSKPETGDESESSEES